MNEILTAILIIITGLYAFFTYKILQANNKVIQEMQTQREVAYRPYILVTTKPSSNTGIFYLNIRNTGLSVASNLKLTIDKDFYQHGRQEDQFNLKSQNVFTNKTKHFVPSAEFVFELSDHWSLFDDNVNESIMPKRFTISAEYEHKENVYKEDTTIDLNQYLNTIMANDSIVNELGRINDTLQSIRSDRREEQFVNKFRSNNTFDSEDT